MRKDFRRFAKRLLGRSRQTDLHAASNAKARAAYQVIVAQEPGRALSPATREQINQYSHDVFGSRAFAPWLEVYAAYRGVFLEGWIPGNYLSKVLVPSWTRYANIDAKVLARRVLGSDAFPDVAYHVNGSWLDLNYEDIGPDSLRDRLFTESDHAFLKLDRSSRGEGVWKIHRSAFDPDRLARLGDFVVQRPIEQHPFFAQFSSESVATVRITTVKQPGQRAEKKASYVRIGRSGAEFIRSDAQLRVPVIDDGGTLGGRGADSSWRSLTAHPDSGAEFAGQSIPSFAEAVRMCETLHDRTPVTVLVGWDVAIDREGRPKLMEWNQGPAATKFSEASVGPCFKGLGWENIWKPG